MALSSWGRCVRKGLWHCPLPLFGTSASTKVGGLILRKGGRVRGALTSSACSPKGEQARLSEDTECLRSSWTMAF